LIHQRLRGAIETAVHEELLAALGRDAVRAQWRSARLPQRHQGARAQRPDRAGGAHGAPGGCCSERPAQRNGPRRSSSATSGDCAKWTRPWRPRTYTAFLRAHVGQALPRRCDESSRRRRRTPDVLHLSQGAVEDVTNDEHNW